MPAHELSQAVRQLSISMVLMGCILLFLPWPHLLQRAVVLAQVAAHAHNGARGPFHNAGVVAAGRHSLHTGRRSGGWVSMQQLCTLQAMREMGAWHAACKRKQCRWPTSTVPCPRNHKLCKESISTATAHQAVDEGAEHQCAALASDHVGQVVHDLHEVVTTAHSAAQQQ